MSLRTFSGLVFSLTMAATLLAQDPAKPPSTEPGKPAAPAREPGLYGTITTSMGDITVKLFEKEAPVTVKNFTDLAQGRKTYLDPKSKAPVKKPLYNGLTFHRVIPNFMIQGGDPLGDGTGGTEPIKDEFSPNLKFDTPGRLAMANAGPGTGSCQFFITEGPTPHLNGLHTIFGQVIEGQEVVHAIANVPRGANDKPRTPVIIKKVTITRVGPAPASEAKPVAKKSAAPAKKAAPAKTTPPAK